jgi:branched-chain amino acid transport system substrate-binding protein
VRVARRVRDAWRTQVLVVAVCAGVLAAPVGTASAAARRAPADGPPIKVGIMAPITSATAANPGTGDAFKAAIAALNKRGGAGKNHNRIQGIVCDTRGDANGEVECARKFVEAGVVATLGDLAFNNPSGVVEVLEAAQIPRIGVAETNLAEFSSSVSYPVSAGIVGAYIGVGVGFDQAHKNKVTLLKTDSPTGAAFKGFIEPPLNKVGDQVAGDIAIATGSTDYAPYVADVQNSGASSLLMAIDDASAAQFIAALEQLNEKILMGGHPGTFTLDTLRKFKDTTKGTLLAESFPYPSQNNVKNFPGLKQFFADMKASKKENLQPKNLQPTDFGPWISALAFVKVTENLDTITKETVLQGLKTAQNIDLLGLTPPWTPSTPGYSLFKSSSNHFVYLSKFDGKNVVTQTKPIDISQYFS